MRAMTPDEGNPLETKKQPAILLTGRAAQDVSLYCLLLKDKAKIQSTYKLDEAIGLADHQGIVDLLIMEILVPGYEGLQEVAYLRNHLPDIPILIQVDNELFGGERGFILQYGDAVVEKPLNRKKVINALSTLNQDK